MLSTWEDTVGLTRDPEVSELGTFIRKMLGRNKQKLSGWCRFPGIGKVIWSQEVKLGKILNVQSFRIQ